MDGAAGRSGHLGFPRGWPVVSLLALGAILKLQFRRDLAHDYLRDVAGTYFNRGGFCFALAIRVVEGIAYMYAYFQDQRDKPCVGRIAVRPARGFFMTRANIASVTYEVECPAAGFGFARVAIPVPRELQGKRQSLEVGASVEYPHGKGKRVRFLDGILLRSNSNFRNSFGTALMVAGAATGSFVLVKPARVTLELPLGVSEEIPDDVAPETKVLWKLGDPPLETVT